MSTVVLVPGAPVLVPELGGTAAARQRPVVDYVLDMLGRAAGTTRSVTVVGAAPSGSVLGDHAGSLSRWGAPVVVGRGASLPDERLPDALVMAWWWLDSAGVAASRRFVPDVDLDAATTADSGGLVLVVADGPAALDVKGPVPDDPRAHRLDDRLSSWIDSGGELPDVGADVAEAVGWWSRRTWIALAGLVAHEGAPARHGHHGGRLTMTGRRSWAPFGVGYHAARWEAGL